MLFTRRTYRVAARKAYKEQDRLWRAYNKFRRTNGYNDPEFHTHLNQAIRFKERIYTRWWRERHYK